MTELRTGQGKDQDLTTDSEEIQNLLTNHFKDWYAAPVLSEEETDIHTSVLDWQRLSGDKEYFMEQTKSTKVPDKYRHLAFEALHVQDADTVRDQLTNAFDEGPSLEDFITAISTAPNQSAPGVTGFTYAMMKAWPPEAIKLAHKALSTMWTDKYIPPWWKWRWLVPVPKKKDPGMADLRPLTLVEATRKIWSRLVIMKITRAWDNNSVLNAAQHGFRNKMSTMTATLQYINALEDARESGQPIHRSSWDMSKAFDTVSKPAMMIAWLRLGVPEQIATWLVGLDMDGVTIVRTSSARRAWQQAHYQGIRAGEQHYTQKMRPMTRHQLLCVHMIDAFKVELGTGQGDVSSPMCWNALFDILLVMLERSDQTPYYCRGATGNMYKSGETAFADDMESTSATNSGMQDKANVVSAFCLIFGLRISPSKLRRYFQDWSNNVGQGELTKMTVYTKGWNPNTVEIEVDGVTSYLGAKYEIQTGNQPQMLQDILNIAREHCNAIQHTSGSPMSKLMVVTTSTYKKIQYQAKIASFTLAQYRQLDTIFSIFYRKITSNMPTFPTALIYTSGREGGLSLQRISDLIQMDKLAIIWKGEQMAGKCWQATEGLLERASRQGGIHIGQYGIQITNNYKGKEQQWVRSVVEWLAEDGKYLTSASRYRVSLDSYIIGCMDMNELDLGNMNEWGITKLADLYRTTKQGVNHWYIPPELQLDRLKHQCPPIGEVALNYGIQQGQYWELEEGRDECEEKVIIEIKGWDQQEDTMYVSYWVRIANTLWMKQSRLAVKTLELRQTCQQMKTQLYVGPLKYRNCKASRVIKMSMRRHCPELPRVHEDRPDWLQQIQESIQSIPDPCIYTDGSWLRKHTTFSQISRMTDDDYTALSATASVVIINRENWQRHKQIILHIGGGENIKCSSAYTMEYIALAAALAIGHELQTKEPIKSDCQSVLKVIEDSDYHLQAMTETHRTLLQYVHTKLKQGQPMPQHVKGHPERTIPDRSKWLTDHWGNHLADRAAAADWDDFTNIRSIQVEAKELLGDLLIAESWYISDADTRPDDRVLLLESATLRRHTEYLAHRDANRLGPQKWTWNTIRLAAKSYGIHAHTPIDIRSTYCRLIYDKGWHGGNRRKRKGMKGYAETDSLCVICNEKDSQYHWICECKGANLQAARETMAKEATLLAADLIEATANGKENEYPTRRHTTHTINEYYLKHINHPTDGFERIWLNNWSTRQREHFDGLIGDIPVNFTTPTANILLRWGRLFAPLVRYMWAVKHQHNRTDDHYTGRDALSELAVPLANGYNEDTIDHEATEMQTDDTDQSMTGTHTDNSEQAIAETLNEQDEKSAGDKEEPELLTMRDPSTRTRPRRMQKPMGFYAETGSEVLMTDKPQRQENPCPRDTTRGSIYIVESRLGPFRGAYARTNLAYRTKIATYTGQFKPDCTNTHYVYHDAGTNITRDTWDHQLNKVRCLAGFLNDPLDDTKANCRFIIQDRRYLRVETLCDIAADEELLLSYGGDYWLHNEFNLEITEKAYNAYSCRDKPAWDKKIHELHNRDKAAQLQQSTSPSTEDPTGDRNPTREEADRQPVTKWNFQKTPSGSTRKTPRGLSATLSQPPARLRYYITNEYKNDMNGYRLLLKIPNKGTQRKSVLQILQQTTLDIRQKRALFMTNIQPIFILSLPADPSKASECTGDGLCLPRALKLAEQRDRNEPLTDPNIRNTTERNALWQWMKTKYEDMMNSPVPVQYNGKAIAQRIPAATRIKLMMDWLRDNPTATFYENGPADEEAIWGAHDDIIPIMAKRTKEKRPIAMFTVMRHDRSYYQFRHTTTYLREAVGLPLAELWDLLQRPNFIGYERKHYFLLPVQDHTVVVGKMIDDVIDQASRAIQDYQRLHGHGDEEQIMTEMMRLQPHPAPDPSTVITIDDDQTLETDHHPQDDQAQEKLGDNNHGQPSTMIQHCKRMLEDATSDTNKRACGTNAVATTAESRSTRKTLRQQAKKKKYKTKIKRNQTTNTVNHYRNGTLTEMTTGCTLQEGSHESGQVQQEDVGGTTTMATALQLVTQPPRNAFTVLCSTRELQPTLAGRHHNPQSEDPSWIPSRDYATMQQEDNDTRQHDDRSDCTTHQVDMKIQDCTETMKDTLQVDTGHLNIPFQDQLLQEIPHWWQPEQINKDDATTAPVSTSVVTPHATMRNAFQIRCAAKREEAKTRKQQQTRRTVDKEKGNKVLGALPLECNQPAVETELGITTGKKKGKRITCTSEELDQSTVEAESTQVAQPTPVHKTTTSISSNQTTRAYTGMPATLHLHPHNRYISPRNTMTSTGQHIHHGKEGGGKIRRSTDINPARATSTSMQEHVDNLRRLRETTASSWQAESVKAMLSRMDGNAWRTQQTGAAIDVAAGKVTTTVDIDHDIENIDIDVDEHNHTHIDVAEVDIASNTMTDSCLDFDKAINDR